MVLIIIIMTSILAGFSKAICDLSEEGKLKFKNKKFWLKNQSWENKWKSPNIEKFWGSSRWFVFLTDGWHLFGLIERTALIISFILLGILIASSYLYMIGIIVNYIIFILSFHIFYTYRILK